MSKPAAPSRETIDVIASSIELVTAQGEVAKNVLLIPFGEHYGRDGRGPYVLSDRAHGEAVIAATRQFHGNGQMMIDYDHQSFHAQRVGGQAKAAGWIDPASLTVADDGIRGDVEWTDAAESALAAREYRYHSPYFRVDKATRKVTRLVNAGLTNSPNLDLPALASVDPNASDEEGKSMKKLVTLLSSTAVAALGLTAESSDEDTLASIETLVTDHDASEKVLASVRTKLKLADDADEESVLAAFDAAAKAGTPDPTKFVPIDALKDVQDELATIREEKVIAAVDQAIQAGKLTPGQKDWAVEHGKENFASLQSFLGNQPAFEGDAKLKKKASDGEVSLTEEERAVCSTMGWDETEYLEQKKKEAA